MLRRPAPLPWVGARFSLLLDYPDKRRGPAKGRGGDVSGGMLDTGSKQLVVGAALPPAPCAQAGSPLVRLTLQGQQDPLRNQTALVDQARSTVTYYVTSRSNHSAVVLYDSRNVSVLG